MNFFKNIKNVLLRELHRIRTYPVYATIMVLLPVIAFSMLAITFSGGVTRNIPIAVVDMDKTTMSRKLTSMVDATPSAAVEYHAQDMMEGESMIRRGEIEAVVYIPTNFEKDVLSNTPTSVVAYVSGLNITANGLLSKDIQTVVRSYSTAIQVQMLMKTGLSQTQAMAQVMPVHFDKHILFNPYINYGYYLLPSFMPMMLMVFALMATIFAIGAELKSKSAGEWFKAAGGNTMAALVGKLLPYTVWMCFVYLVMTIVIHSWIGVPLNGSVTMLLIGGFMFVLAYQSIAVLIVTLLSNLRLSLSIGGGYSVLAFTFSGLTFPKMAMDPFIQAVSYIFPFTFYTDIFVDQAMRGAPAIHSLHYFGWLALFIILPLFCLPRLKKISTNEEYWGRV